MSRQEDFIQAAYNNDRESSKQEQQFFVEGCEHGYQYAVDKACEWLRENIEYWLGDYNLAEDELEDNQVHYAAMIEELRKSMEE